ncbi:sterol carrier family protein [Janibacter limosus]|uniref:Sterol carrier family protein n=1 Tax=Janibacter limosus TaxID=53458 RepID=A0AC61U4Y2_9MICO|nr:sterol carrier family protein [Janibacter limosus]UUZ45092.1 sterol carrier family protein [Janibacter limosus]
MAGRRRIPVDEGWSALHAWSAARDRSAVARATLATAVRHTVAELADAAPGRSVEVRVPPFAAVQCVAGPVHTRGTPPAVVETDPQTWLELAVGDLTRADGVAEGRVRVSGQRTDLSAHFPLTRPPASP